MANKKVKVTKAYIDELKRQKDYYANELAVVTKDRDIFRQEFLNLLKENIKMCSKGDYYTAATMIEKLSRLMNKVGNWYWY